MWLEARYRYWLRPSSSNCYPHPQTFRTETASTVIDGLNRPEPAATLISAIRQALEADETLEAVVTDIQSFYPSANQKIVLERFVERVNASDDLAHKTEIVAFVRSLLDASPGGIPVGSNLSHVLGNLALEKVDAELERAYPARYFRYVDDIIVLCDRNETVDALRLIKDVLGAEGFALNDFKTDSAAREAWIPKSRGNETFRETAKRFEDFLLRLEVYLARYPARVGEIRTTFNAEGFNFPITRWAAAASQTRFQTFLFRQLRQRPVLTILKFLASDREDLIANAREMRPLLREELHFASQDIPVAGMARRFRLQRIRYLLNRLIYLYPIEQHVDLIDVARRLPELHETELLLTALHTGDATPLLLLPGRTIAAFVELWREAKSGQPNIRWEVFQPKICIDALATLVLGGVVEPPHSVIRALNPHQRELLKFCSGAPGQPVEKVRDSFVDEARRLQNGRAHDFIASLLDTRFSLRESSGLQLFRLDSTYPAY